MSNRADIERVLADPGHGVPAAPPGDRGLAWLRSTVSRFVNGAVHTRRRAIVEGEIGSMSPQALRESARRRTDAALDAADGRIEAMADIARPVPVATLGAGLGLSGDALSGVVADVIAVAPAYATGAADERVDLAVERLRAALDRGGPEETAAAIAVLVQACEATAALIGNAVALADQRPELPRDVDALVRETALRLPPVRLMRRVSDDGDQVTLDVETASQELGPGDATLTFGSGLRPCPASEHAVALASGVLDALLPRCTRDPDVAQWAELPAIRIPERLELTVA